jgi:putative copper resistance protein D
VAGFFDVLLRGIVLASQALAVGGVFFILFVLRPGGLPPATLTALARRSLALVIAGAAGVATAQCFALVVQLVGLGDGAGWPLRELSGTTYFRASGVRIALCVALVAAALAARRRGQGTAASWTLGVLAVLLATSAAWLSHAMARLDHRVISTALDATHQLAAAVWVGGLVHLTVAALRGPRAPWPISVLRRFSTMALAAVAVLVVAGVALSTQYIDGVPALLGTSYGVMVITKGVLLAVLLVLGAANFLAVRRLRDGADVALTRVRRFVEVELGLGLTVLFAAASLTSMPPAVDVPDRASVAEVAARFTPQWPRLSSPPITDLPVEDRDAPRTAADRAWSEYNHHMAGFFVLAMGVLALVQRARWGRWARHWPLVFLGLAAFLLVRNDPGAWPLGPLGFWESFGYAEVLQHRLFVLLVVGFGLFEWRVRAGRLGHRRAALVFPLLCAVGGGLLLTHSHALGDLKAEFLIEITHTPLGVLGLMAGWARWLELRMAPPDDALPGRLWAWAFSLVGVFLIFYRES